MGEGCGKSKLCVPIPRIPSISRESRILYDVTYLRQLCLSAGSGRRDFRTDHLTQPGL